MIKECVYCFNAEINEEEGIIWCNRYDCNVTEVAKEQEEPSCWETLADHDARRLAVCWECRKFWWSFPNRPAWINGCTEGREIPNGEASKTCVSFKEIKGEKK